MMFSITYILLWGLVILQFMICLALVSQIQVLRGIPLEKLAPGTPAPAFSGVEFASRRRVKSSVLAGKASAIILLEPTCPSCLQVADGLRGAEYSTVSSVLVISIVKGAENHGLQKRLGNVPLIVDVDLDVRRAFGLSGAPSGVIMDPDSRIVQYWRPRDVGELRQLLNQAANGMAMAHKGDI